MSAMNTVHSVNQTAVFGDSGLPVQLHWLSRWSELLHRDHTHATICLAAFKSNPRWVTCTRVECIRCGVNLQKPCSSFLSHQIGAIWCVPASSAEVPSNRISPGLTPLGPWHLNTVKIRNVPSQMVISCTALSDFVADLCLAKQCLQCVNRELHMIIPKKYVDLHENSHHSKQFFWAWPCLDGDSCKMVFKGQSQHLAGGVTKLWEVLVTSHPRSSRSVLLHPLNYWIWSVLSFKNEIDIS